MIDPLYTGVPKETLQPGENVYAYVMGLTDADDPRTPLVVDGTDGAGFYNANSIGLGRGLERGPRGRHQPGQQRHASQISPARLTPGSWPAPPRYRARAGDQLCSIFPTPGANPFARPGHRAAPTLSGRAFSNSRIRRNLRVTSSMRARSPYELQPRQLRALVLLLALLPLVPMTFVVRFVAEDIADQRLEARERARPVYQKFLDATTDTLITNAARQVPSAPELDPAHPWRLLQQSPALADTVLVVSPESALMAPAAPAGDPRLAHAANLAEAVLQGGVRYAPLPPQGPVRWRFFCEIARAPFRLAPAACDPAPAARGPTLLLVKSRQHLLETVGTFFQRELNPQSALRLIDENGDIIPLVGPAESASLTGGDPLAESTLQPPLPAWRVQLFSVDASLVDGVARGQIALYWWSVIGMFAVTASIAGAAGWALTRRLALHELGNDALAVVSHEMKTPLTSMRMFIETLRERRYHGGSEQADEYLALIADENARLVRLVEGFQTVSRLDNLRARGVVCAANSSARRRSSPRPAADGTASGRRQWPVPRRDRRAAARAVSGGPGCAGRRAGQPDRQRDEILRRGRARRPADVCAGGRGRVRGRGSWHRDRSLRAEANFRAILPVRPAAFALARGLWVGPEHRALGGARARRQRFRAERSRAGQHLHGPAPGAIAA